MTDVKFKRKVEGYLHVFINIYCFTGAIVITTSRLYFTDDNGICDIRLEPSCAETTIDSTCKKENVKVAVLRWVFSDALILLNFLYIIIVWRKVIRAVTRTNKQSDVRRFGAQSSCKSTPNTTSQVLKRFAGVIGFSENSRTSELRQQRPSQYSSSSRNKQQSVSRNPTVARFHSDSNIGEYRRQMTGNELSSPPRSGILRTMSRKYSVLDSNISDADSICRPSCESRRESLVDNLQSRPSSSSRRIPDFNLSEVRSKASEVMSQPLVDIDENGVKGKRLRRTSVPKRRTSTRIQIQKELINLQSKLFISFYVLVWLFPLCCHIVELVDKRVPSALIICSLLLNPLFGSLGCCLYCFPHIMSKVRTRDTSWYSTAFEVLKKGGDGDRIGVSRRRNSVFDQDKVGNLFSRTIFKKLILKSTKTRTSKAKSKERNCLGLSVHDIAALKQLDIDEDGSSTKERKSPLEVDHTTPLADINNEVDRIESAKNIDCVKEMDIEEQLTEEQDANDVETRCDEVNNAQINDHHR